LTTNSSGGFQSHVRYKPFGEVRNGYSSAGMVTDKLFTGQEREPVGYVGNIDLFGARFYSPVLGRFISADTIVPRPGDPQAFNRYAYARNSPLNRIDPSGHADGGFWTGVWDFVQGATYQFSDDVSLGTTTATNPQAADALSTNKSEEFSAGRIAGRIASSVFGVAETIGGGGLFLGSLGGGVACTAATAGACAPAAIPASAGGMAMGVGMIAHGAGILAKNTLDPLAPPTAMMSQNDIDGDSIPDHWATPKTLQGHFNDHGSDFGAKSATDYANKANDSYNRGRSSGSIQSAHGYGQTYYYEKKTNTLGIYTDGGKTVTFLKPDRGERYWRDLLQELGYE
jgi:RHS repeat-associated protein